MAGDYIHAGDAQFHAWQNNFVTYVNNHLADLGLVAGETSGFTSGQSSGCHCRSGDPAAGERF